jgi:hypothetical protein
MPPGVRRDRVRAVEAAFLKNAEGSGSRRRGRKNTHDPKPDLRDHPAQHDRRMPVHARGSKKRKAPVNPHAEGQRKIPSPFRNP